MAEFFVTSDSGTTAIVSTATSQSYIVSGALIGPAGADGATGATGATGAAGQGVPTGGTTGQVLSKASNTNYDTAWTTASGGSSTVSVSTKTGNYTLTASDDVVLGDTTSGSITLTLPTAVGVTKTFTLKKIASANTLNIATTSSQTIDGSTTIAITVQNESITVASNNANWFVT